MTTLTPAAETVMRRNRKIARVAQGVGTVVAACGIGAVVCGGVLPWATITIWSLPFALPGLVFAWGGASVGAALMAGGRLGQKRFPWLIAVLGLLPFCAGIAAPKIAGQAVRGFILQWENTLAPTNARLAQATLPPIEPFEGVGPAASYVGPGVRWTLWGGVAMLVGGTLFAGGERTTRTCFSCWRAWASARTGEISFCRRAENLPPRWGRGDARRAAPPSTSGINFVRCAARQMASPPNPLPEAGRGSLLIPNLPKGERFGEFLLIQAPPSRFGEGVGGRGRPFDKQTFLVVSSNYFGTQSECAQRGGRFFMSDAHASSDFAPTEPRDASNKTASPPLRQSRRAATRRVFLRLCGAAVGVGVAAPLDARFVEPFAVQVTRHTVFLPDLPLALDGVTLVHLTDLHRGPITPDSTIAQAVALARGANPDMVILTGDFVDSRHEDAAPVAKLLGPLANAGLGLWGVLGNHDYHSNADTVAETLTRDAGVRMLRNQSAQIAPGLWASGIEDTLRGKPDTNAALANVPPGKALLFLTHNPVGVWGVSSRPTLALAGHTHGGQVVVPGFPVPVPPGMDGFPLLAGWGTFDKTRLYVSRGVGMAAFPLRFRCRPEVAIMTLRRGVGQPLTAPHLGERVAKKAMRTARRVLKAVG